MKEVYDQGNKFIVTKVPAGTYGVQVRCILKVLVEGDMNLALLSVNYSSKSEFNGTTTISQDQADVHYIFLEGTPVDSYQKIGITWRKDMSTLGSTCSKKKIIFSE